MISRFFIVILLSLFISCSGIEHNELAPTSNKIVGADISFIDQVEYWDINFYDNGIKEDLLSIFKKYGFNFIRLRLFVDPDSVGTYDAYNIERDQSVSFCGRERTLGYAKQVKSAGFKFLLDLHYSDNWADPGQQRKPNSWVNLTYDQLKSRVYSYTKESLEYFIENGVTPDIIQIGNEITYGFLWDVDTTKSGNSDNIEQFTGLLKEGIRAVRDVSSSIRIMLHTTDSSKWWVDQIVAKSVDFDILGISYYPKYSGTTEALKSNLTEIANSYSYDIVVVEYSKNKQEVNDIVFNLPNNRGLGAFIWEPVNWNDSEQAENIFDWQTGTNEGFYTNSLINFYSEIDCF